jgi:hypothetical protein
MRFLARRGLVALCLLTVSGLGAAATMYKWTDAQGVVHYSDTPHPGAEMIQISGAQTYHNTSTNSTPTNPAAAAAAAQASKSTYTCAITQPASEEALYAPETVDISVQATPALRAGDSVSVQVDGQSLPSIGGDGLRFQMPSPERGTHTVSAQILGADGAVVCNAPAVSFSVQRPSVNAPTSPVKPH